MKGLRQRPIPEVSLSSPTYNVLGWSAYDCWKPLPRTGGKLVGTFATEKVVIKVWPMSTFHRETHSGGGRYARGVYILHNFCFKTMKAPTSTARSAALKARDVRNAFVELAWDAFAVLMTDIFKPARIGATDTPGAYSLQTIVVVESGGDIGDVLRVFGLSGAGCAKAASFRREFYGVSSWWCTPSPATTVRILWQHGSDGQQTAMPSSSHFEGGNTPLQVYRYVRPPFRLNGWERRVKAYLRGMEPM